MFHHILKLLDQDGIENISVLRTNRLHLSATAGADSGNRGSFSSRYEHILRHFTVNMRTYSLNASNVDVTGAPELSFSSESACD